MTELSPAAQAVLDAATPALNNLDACGFNHQAYDRKAIAAALRSAAIYCPVDCQRLATIAAELDPANSTFQEH